MQQQQVDMMIYIQQIHEQQHDYAGRNEHMLWDLIVRVQGLQIGLEEIDSTDLQLQITHDNLMDDMFYYMHGMGIPLPPSHYGQPRGRGRGRHGLIWVFSSFLSLL